MIVQHTGHEAPRAGVRPPQIKQMKGAAGSEDAPDLPQGLLLLVWLQVVEHEGGEHAIEGRRGIRKRIRKPLIEVDGDRCPCRLSYGVGERLRIGIDANDLDLRMPALEQYDQAASAAADVEHA